MPVFYQNRYFRAQQKDVKFILPGDHARAQDYGFANIYRPASHLLDEAAFELARLVAVKGWEIPGINVVLDADRDDEMPIHRLVSLSGTLPGNKWHIHYDRQSYQQVSEHPAKNGVRPVRCAPERIVVPGHDVRFYDDGSSIYYKYVGDDWRRDENAFLQGAAIRSKAMGYPRRYLMYDLGKDNHYHHTNNAGTEYDPMPHEPKKIMAMETHIALLDFMESVMKDLEKRPDHVRSPYGVWDRYAHVDPIKNNDLVPELYVTADRATLKNKSYLLYGGKPFSENRYDVLADHPLEVIAYNEPCRFAYADYPQYDPTGLWGDDPYAKNTVTYRVNLRYANDVYVADRKPLHDCRHYYAMDKVSGQEFTEEEKAEQFAVMARTIVPLASYRGGYERPLYLINRPLWSDEAQEVVVDKRNRPHDGEGAASGAAVAHRVSVP